MTDATKFIQWLQGEFERHGWKIVAFVRLNPIFPGPVNFLFGFTSMPFRTYCWSTTVFLIPATVAFAIVGHSIGQLLLRGYVENLRHTLLSWARRSLCPSCSGWRSGSDMPSDDSR